MYEPETDSEDELPPGWEERATLTGKMSRVKYFSCRRLYQYSEVGFYIYVFKAAFQIY